MASLSPSALPLPGLIFPFRLHGDSPLRLACIPASARDSVRLHPSLLWSPVSRSPVSSPWGEASLLFPDCHIYFLALTESAPLGRPSPTLPPPARLQSPSRRKPSLLPAEGLLGLLSLSWTPYLCPGAHAEVRLVSRFLLSLAWQTGESSVLRSGKERGWEGATWGWGMGLQRVGEGPLKPRIKMEVWILS